jgi:mRNA-degrading endonuclease YafQ of YafQ-DinJ toxin-antitoxin module
MCGVMSKSKIQLHKEGEKMLIIKKIHFYYLALATSLLLTGCSANYNSIYRSKELKPDGSMVFTVDAKQRFLISTMSEIKTQSNGVEKTEKVRRFCAEYSPDVFSVLSQAGSGSGSFGQSSDPKSISLTLQAAFSSAETGSTITRTQTINMLKEMMYRTCERYLNGQIGEYEYPMIAARDQRIMISILAIEQLTGTVTPKPTIIASTGTGTTGQQTVQAIKSLEDAQNSVSSLKEKVGTLKQEFDDINTEDGICNALLAKKVEEVSGEDNKTIRQKCNITKEKLTEANDSYEKKKVYFDSLLSLAGKPGESSSTTKAEYLASSPKTEIDKEIEMARLHTIEHVSDTVLKIVDNSFDPNDETSFFCYRAIEKKLEDKNVIEACKQFLLTKVQQNTLILKEYLDAKQELQLYSKKQFEQFWKKIKKTDKEEVDTDKLKKIVNQIMSTEPEPIKEKLNCMKTKNDKKEIYIIFKTLPDNTCKKLINAN